MNITLKGLVVAVFFGAIALSIVLAGLHLPIPNTSVVTDPREFATTLGSALSGPLGGLLIGIMAGIAEPGGIPLASLLGHILGCLWMGIAYKTFIYRLPMPRMLFGWVGAIFVYYYIFVVPGFTIGLQMFYNDTTPFMKLYTDLAKGAMIESFFTSFISVLILISLPKNYREPLW